MSFPVDKNYKDFLKEVKYKIQYAQMKAVITVNQQLLYLYWDIGKILIDKQLQEGWGAGITTQLSKDLRKEFPNLKISKYYFKMIKSSKGKRCLKGKRQLACQ